MTREKDALTEAIRKALRTAQGAQKEGHEDLRSSSTVCADYLDSAVKHLEDAAKWMSEYQREVKADERWEPPKAAVLAKDNCHICEEDIDPGDVAVCGGCDKPTCPDCMGDDGACTECEAEDAR